MPIFSDLYRTIFKRIRGKGFGLGIFNRVHRLVWERHLQPEWIDVEGMRLQMPEHDQGVSEILRIEGGYEKEETELLRAHIKPGMTVLDIGANIGYYTLLASHLVGPRGRVLAFEPDPRNFRFLMTNVMENRCDNVTAWPYAVGAALGYADLKLTWPTSGGSHSIVYAPGGTSQKIRVLTVALDDFLDPAACPDLVKMDIEGAEYLALRGMDGMLGNPKLRTLVVECFAEILDSIGKSEEDVVGPLRRHGFRIQRVDRLNLLCTRA